MTPRAMLLASGTGLAVDDGGEHPGTGTELEAEMRGAGRLNGRAKVEVEPEDGGTKVVFGLRVRGATANATFDVVVDGVTVGSIATDARGEGEIELLNPANFPEVKVGSTIQVGNILQGTFAQDDNDD